MTGSRRHGEALHAVTWFVWAVCAGVCVQLARSPVYVIVVIGVAALVVEAHNAGGLLSRAFPVLVGVGVAFGLVKVALTVLTTHGSTGVLVRLPQVTVPDVVGGFDVGGTIESQVLAQATMEALVIVGVMAVFGAFNAVVSHDELVASLPRTFHEPGLVLTVGLAFVPATISAVRAVQESDRCRTGGTVARRGRLVRLTVPLLETGMERAISLSESMDARGFAHQAPGAVDRTAAWLAFAGILSFGGVLVALIGESTATALALLVLGGALLGGAVVTGSRGSKRTRYRRRSLHPFDLVVMAGAVGAVTGLAALTAVGHDTLVWDVEPLGYPSLHIGPLVALSLLAVPVLRPLGARVPDTHPTGPDHQSRRGAESVS
jgi:energy-coupling factor transport system permease protein